MRTCILGVATVLVLGGCQTAEQVEDDRSARIRAYHGRTMAAFIGDTGLVPITYYPIDGGRVFVVEGPPVVSSYGGYSNTTACRLQIQTRHSGSGSTADDWTIVGTTRTGPCQLLPT